MKTTVTFGPVPDASPRTARFDAEALYQAIDKRRRAKHISQREVVRRAGITQLNVLTRLGRGAQPNADTLVALLVWLGDTDLGPYIRREEQS